MRTLLIASGRQRKKRRRFISANTGPFFSNGYPSYFDCMLLTALTLDVQLPRVLEHSPVHLRVGGPAPQRLFRVLGAWRVSQRRGRRLAAARRALKKR